MTTAEQQFINLTALPQVDIPEGTESPLEQDPWSEIEFTLNADQQQVGGTCRHYPKSNRLEYHFDYEWGEDINFVIERSKDAGDVFTLYYADGFEVTVVRQQGYVEQVRFLRHDEPGAGAVFERCTAHPILMASAW